jgi:hypothetical protein
MPYSEAVRPTRLGIYVSACLRTKATTGAHSAISPRFAISTEVRDVVAGALVEL